MTEDSNTSVQVFSEQVNCPEGYPVWAIRQHLRLRILDRIPDGPVCVTYAYFYEGVHTITQEVVRLNTPEELEPLHKLRVTCVIQCISEA